MQTYPNQLASEINQEQKWIIANWKQQQSMVKIKYNNPNMNNKSTPNFIQTRKRTLRSSIKMSSQEHPVTATSSEEKVIQEIHKQFDNQQSINVSKSTDPLHQDHKPTLLPPYQSQCNPKNNNLTPRSKCKSNKIDNNLSSKKLLEKQSCFTPNLFNEVVQVRQNISKQYPDIFETPVKPQNHNVRNENSYEFKKSMKSYRKVKRTDITQIPYRKFQNPFEQKIVILINKILHNKGTQKDIQNFTQKIPKISSKDIYNPYIVSGIKTVASLIEKSSLPANCVSKLKSELKKLSTKILFQLQRTDDYENAQIQIKKETNYDSFKPKFIKKIYKFLLQTNQYEFNQAKQKSVFLCESFFAQSNNFINEDELLLFFQQKKFLEG